MLIIWNISSTFLQLCLHIYGDFHISFRNLPNFFREHARGARAIFHLWFQWSNSYNTTYEQNNYQKLKILLHILCIGTSTIPSRSCGAGVRGWREVYILNCGFFLYDFKYVLLLYFILYHFNQFYFILFILLISFSNCLPS